MFSVKLDKRKSPPLDLFSRPELVKVMMNGRPVSINIEINERCAGGCLYCYTSSRDSDNLKIDSLSLDKFKDILEIKKLGTKVVYLYGGDQLIHPNCKEMVYHAIDEGFHLFLPLAGLIPNSKISWLINAQSHAKAQDLEFIIGIHIDTLDQEIYDQVNCFPNTLKAKIDGYDSLLEAGFPPDHIYGCPTLTRQTAGSMVALMDWFYSKGATHVAIMPFRPLGLSKNEGARWEPSLSQIEKVFNHRAKVEGKHMLMVGSSDGKYACQSHIAVTANGDVVPCLYLRDLPEGNIYEENILKIYKRARRKLLLRVKVKGPCASCKAKMYCYGCRANAYIYCGDITASDPKCFYNPDAPDKCL